MGRKWDKDYNNTAFELANCWKSQNEELHGAMGCKVYIIDAKLHPYKKQLLNLGVQPLYDAKKGIIFRKKILN